MCARQMQVTTDRSRSLRVEVRDVVGRRGPAFPLAEVDAAALTEVVAAFQRLGVHLVVAPLAVKINTASSTGSANDPNRCSRSRIPLSARLISSTCAPSGSCCGCGDHDRVRRRPQHARAANVEAASPVTGRRRRVLSGLSRRLLSMVISWVSPQPAR